MWICAAARGRALDGDADLETSVGQTKEDAEAAGMLALAEGMAQYEMEMTRRAREDAERAGLLALVESMAK